MNKIKTKAQRKVILAELKRGKKLTFLDTLTDFGIYRLAARIHELRQLGYDIKTDMIAPTKGAAEIAQYYLAK